MYWVVFLTILFESITALLRFYFGLESSVCTASAIGAVTYGVRIHHGYIGILLFAFSISYRRRRPRIAETLEIVAMALFLSDLIHHFLVLWPLTGDPQFHLLYPRADP